jgi:hypothetical protein
LPYIKKWTINSWFRYPEEKLGRGFKKKFQELGVKDDFGAGKRARTTKSLRRSFLRRNKYQDFSLYFKGKSMEDGH